MNSTALNLAETVILVMAMLALALVVRPLTRRFGIPFALSLVVLGFVASESLVMFGIDTGLRSDSFTDLISIVLLPLLIFATAMRLPMQELRRCLAMISILAIPILLLTATLVTLGLFFGIDHATGFPLVTAMIAAVLLVAIDPGASQEVLQRFAGTERLQVLLEGEALFSDALSVLLLGLLLATTAGAGQMVSWGGFFYDLFITSMGGIFIGAVAGAMGVLCLRLTREHQPRALLTVVVAYLSYLLAQQFFMVSDVIAILVTGLCVAWGNARYPAADNKEFVGEVWELLHGIAGASVFLLVGFTIQLEVFVQQRIAILLAIPILILARALGFFALLPVIGRVPGLPSLPAHDRIALHWGGTPGAVALALVLSLPTSLTGWWTVQAIVYGVAIFALLAQLTTLGAILRSAGYEPRR